MAGQYRALGTGHRSLCIALFGFGFTYHASLPLARIDHILHRGFTADYAEVIKVSASDHRGIYAVLSLQSAP